MALPERLVVRLLALFGCGGGLSGRGNCGARRTAPRREWTGGRLRARTAAGLLIGLTVVTGLVDAFSYLTLGHVFVANMTGNVVFFGFALAGAGEAPTVASLLAIVAFVAGAAAGVGSPASRGRSQSSPCSQARLIGGVPLRWMAPPAPLWLATAVLVVCAIGAYLGARSPRSTAWR